MSSTLPSWRMLTLMENHLWWWWDNIPLEKLLLSSKHTKRFVHFYTPQLQVHPWARISRHEDWTWAHYWYISYNWLWWDSSSKQYLIWTSLLKGEPGKIPGNVLAMDTKKPFTQLKQFGGSFLTRYWTYKSLNTENWLANSDLSVPLQGLLFLIVFTCLTHQVHNMFLNFQNNLLAKEWWFRTYFRYSGWREADPKQRIWLYCRP